MAEVIRKKLSLAEKKDILRKKEKLLSAREKLSTQNQMINIGKLASKAKINHLDDHTLFGAFLEISKHLSDDSKLTAWKMHSENKNKEKESGKPLTISFKLTPDKEVKDLLKLNKFKWNSFRREYYGFGDKAELSKLFKNIECKIEVIA